jgi:formylglycine-generating enzyme required for sulfatase activity
MTVRYKPNSPDDGHPSAGHEDSPPDAKELIPGTEIGDRYEIRDTLHCGGSGSVYLARDRTRKRDVALKILDIDADAEHVSQVLRRLQREAQFRHDNICRIDDAGQVDGRCYVTMPHMEGVPFSSLLDHGVLSEAEAVEVVLILARALADAHEHGFSHLDLKPTNIVINKRRRPVILDFAHEAYESQINQSGQLQASSSYMAPEQVWRDDKKIGPRCDIYSLGLILYELLTGHPRFAGSKAEVVAGTLVPGSEPPSARWNDVDSRLKTIGEKAFARKPEERYASMKAFAKDLDLYKASLGAKTRRLSRRWGLAAVLGAAALTVLGVILYAVTHRGTGKIVVNNPSPVVWPHPPAPAWINSIRMTFVPIEPGKFTMGSTGLVEEEKPPHLVEITRPFSLGQHEVTQGQYRAVMGVNPSYFEGSDDLPVENVSWLDAVTFCNKLSEKEGRAPFYRIYGEKITVVEGNGYRLPTEAEWEYACRAGSTTQYLLGDDKARAYASQWLGWRVWAIINPGL